MAEREPGTLVRRRHNSQHKPEEAKEAIFYLMRCVSSALGCCLQTMTSPSDKLDSSSLKPAALCSLKPILAGLSIIKSVFPSSPSLTRL